MIQIHYKYMSDNWIKISTDNLRVYGYAGMWCLLLIGATYPCVFLERHFRFLSGENSLQETFQGYMFAMVMIFVLHLLDITYVVLSTKIDEAKMRLGLLTTLISTIVVAVCLAFLCAVGDFNTKVFWFILFWIVLFIYKIKSIQLANPNKAVQAQYIFKD